MNHIQRLLFVILALSYTIPGIAQKVKVGYDKGIDFSKYRTYTWATPQSLPSRPLLYDYIVKTIDGELRAKGLERSESNGDLTLIPAGGMEYGSNLPNGTPILPVYGGAPPEMNATMWTGATPSFGSSGPVVAQGSLTLEFVDRNRNEVIWNGTVTQTFDPSQKEKSLDRVEQSITKLLKKFPSKSQ